MWDKIPGNNINLGFRGLTKPPIESLYLLRYQLHWETQWWTGIKNYAAPGYEFNINTFFINITIFYPLEKVRDVICISISCIYHWSLLNHLFQFHKTQHGYTSVWHNINMLCFWFVSLFLFSFTNMTWGYSVLSKINELILRKIQLCICIQQST